MNKYNSTDNKRDHFSSSIGFILASAGSAIGLGNLWKFPYVAGSSGGGLFLIFYIIFTLILGIPLIVAEMSIGRKTQLNPIGAFQKLDKRFTFIGIMGVLCAIVVISYYIVVGGWVIKYLYEFLKGAKDIGTDTELYFNNFVSSPLEPLIFMLIFLAITALIVTGGVSKGIEKISKIMLPALLIMIIIVAIRSLTLEGASKGVEFFLKPHPEQFKSIADVGRVMALAMGQVFFSLSIGTGITVTYGSYLKKNSDITKDAFIITVLDVFVAVLSGLAILPAVFSLNLTPSASPGLLFSTLTHVFEIIPLGKIFGVVFFLLVLFAALTSSISMLEVSASFLIDNFKFSRKKAITATCILVGIVGIFASLSNGTLSGVQILGNNIFDALSFFTDKILMPLTSLFTCIFLGYFFGADKISEEINTGAKKIRTVWLKIFTILIKYVAPILILIIFIMGLIK